MKNVNINNLCASALPCVDKAHYAVETKSEGTPIPLRISGHINPTLRGRPLCSAKHEVIDEPVKKDLPDSSTSIIDNSISKDSLSEKIVEKALRGLAMRVGGFTLREVKITYEEVAGGVKKAKNHVVTSKKVAPDLAAIIFALTNLNGQNWTTKPGSNPEILLSNEDDSIDIEQFPEPILHEIKNIMEQISDKNQ